ncbi:MAG: hypothetical protein JNK96_10870 [Betaproteobacteria bacterium]|jgi:uncharacterized membrane protein YccC|nr:hypothetical protein [Betaproteobacteria bacterium]HMV19963.1 hypothetical protein [Rhodocyclaceae bacterium]HMW76998.1 hypothetical protein [Rhodocyclaceae bacterium]HNE42826.1 hypothetical protein [Rhodocyclaceae bacterium]HNM21172.1 hypothetical protein [Rhodocyclaceae bacterium]
MNEAGRILWIVAKVMFLLVGIGAILAGGICGAIMVPSALDHDAMARDFLGVAAAVLVVGLVVAIPTWRSLRRDRQAAKAKLEADLEAIRRKAGPSAAIAPSEDPDGGPPWRH